MKSFTFPILTVGLVVIIAGLYGLIPSQSLLYFSADAITRGETWRLITGHLAHADQQHLLWNCLGLVVLGGLVEQHSRALLLKGVIVGIFAVSVLLMTPFAALDYYCGLSGALNTLLVIAVWLEWQRSPCWPVAVVAICSVFKTVIETSLGTSIVTNISWPTYAWAHLAGMMGGIMLIAGQVQAGDTKR
jgi:rhomboid family GlyGly-CTERM serine protease